jgi:hypothetical protein
MKRSLVFVIAGLILAASAFAGPQAVLSGIKGKVEVKPVSGDWAPASEGMVIDLKTTVSTGFDSTATVVIDKSKIVVKPLTRLTLDKLLEQSSGSIAASMFLRVGAVQASVKASVPGTPQDYKVQSPYSTASVRGTEFEFDGLHLAVHEGTVRLIPGRPHRDVEGGGDEGFEGAANVGGANSNGSVDVHQGQDGNVHVNYVMDTGNVQSQMGSGGPSNAAPGAGPSSHGAATGSVSITITSAN